MAETRNRKACDRCHDQKLSCKRVGDGDCERCSKARRPCKSSPSLRYRKHRVDQHQSASESSRAARNIRMTPQPLSAREPRQDTISAQTQYASFPSNPEYIESTYGYTNEAGLGIAFDLSDYGSPDALSYSSSGVGNMENTKSSHNNVYDGETWGSHLTWSSADLWGPIISDSATSSVPAPPSASDLMDVSFGNTSSTWNTQSLTPTSTHSDATSASSVAHTAPMTPLRNQLLEVNEQVCELLDYSLPEAISASQCSGLSVEQLFKLSTSFSNTIDVLGDLAESRHHPSDKYSGDSDLATSLFILSIYTRFLDAYKLVFSPLRARDWSRSAETLRAWKLPDIVVGSIQMDFTPSMQLSLTIKLASQCLGTISRAVDRLHRADKLTCSSHDVDNSSRIIEDTLRIIRMKENHIRTQVLDTDSLGQLSHISSCA